MKNNVLNITTIYTMLVACATLMIIACPEPDKPTTKTQPTNTGPFTITFNLDGGTGNDGTNPQTIALDKKATKPKNDPTKDKAIFGLWYQDKKFTIPFFFDTPITQDISLYARWNKPNHFTVRFNPNGGSATNIIEDQIIALNNKATLPTPPPPHQKQTSPLVDGTRLPNPQHYLSLSLILRRLPQTPSSTRDGTNPTNSPLRLTPMMALPSPIKS